tara:strand:+ start:16401 stop:17351 length:951 start_codon:yes stop_codon:yes gene_type:complete
MKKINPKNKICIYLDQFVISDIIEGKNPLWAEIKELLEINYSNGKIYCPLSTEHFLETVGKNINDAKEHDVYFRKISDNYLLKTEPFLTSQLISSLIRKNNTTLNTFLIVKNLKNIEDIYSDINLNHTMYSEGITSTLSKQNEIRKLISPTKNHKNEIGLISIIKNLEVQNFKNRLDEYIKAKSIRIRADNFGEHQIPNWIDQLLYQLTNKHQFKEKQLKQLFEELKAYGFNRIPTLNTKFSIGSYLAVKNKQENSGDHIDIMRISSYLFSVDIFFTDKKRKYEICDLGLDKKYNTVVFSGVKQDLVDVVKLLKSL